MKTILQPSRHPFKNDLAPSRPEELGLATPQCSVLSPNPPAPPGYSYHSILQSLGKGFRQFVVKTIDIYVGGFCKC